LTNKPKITRTRKYKIGRKRRRPNLTEQNTIGITDINKVPGSGVDIARFDDFGSVWDLLIGLIENSAIADLTTFKNVVSADLSSDMSRKHGMYSPVTLSV